MVEGGAEGIVYSFCKRPNGLEESPAAFESWARGKA